MAYAKMTQGQLDSLIHVVNDKAKISDMATQLGAKADLVSGKVPLSQLPSDIGGGKATFIETNITATAGQTVFNVTYSVGAVEVYMNGVKMTSGVDFTATNGTSITLTSGATVGDEISVLAYSTFSVANAYTKSETDVKLANITVDNLTDVTTMSPVSGQALVWNGTAWVNANKQDTLVSGTSIKTVNGTSLLGSGNISISAGVTSVTAGTTTTLFFLGHSNTVTPITTNQSQFIFGGITTGGIIFSNNKSTTYVKSNHEYKAPYGGTYTVSFAIGGGTIPATYTTSARVYVNNVAVGTERIATTSGMSSYSENIAVNAGDVIQIYAKTSNTAVGVQLYSFKISVNELLPSIFPSVITL